MYQAVRYFNNRTQQFESEVYSPYREQLFGAPSPGKSGNMSFSLDNNLEAKVPVVRNDSVTDRKISLIDNLGLRISYNFLADSLNWSNTNASIRLKVLGTTLSLQGQFDTYLYNEQGRHINVTRWHAGKGIGRFMGTSVGYSYALNNEAIKKLGRLFQKKEGKNESPDPNDDTSSASGEDASQASENTNDAQQPGSLRKKKESEGEFDSNGYLLSTVPWNLSFNYSLNYAYDMANFNKETREYPYKISQTLGISGSITPTKGWSFNFSTSYDFDYKRFATMQCSLSRQMHCWSMSASIIPIGPYQSYNFTIAVNSSLLKDLKYTQSSNYRDSMNWGE
jgi:hypothetical protein